LVIQVLLLISGRRGTAPVINPVCAVFDVLMAYVPMLFLTPLYYIVNCYIVNFVLYC